MSYAIITDSSANLPEAMIDEFDLHILSLVFRIKDKEYYGYVKGETTDLAQFYTRMREKENITTSLINVEFCESYMRKLLDAGEDVLYIGFSSGLSGTYQAVAMVADQLREEYPQRKILTVDTLAAALGEGLLVYYACSMKKAGKSLEEVYQWLLDNRLHLCHWFTVDDLFFLLRGGRVSAASAIVGSMLSIKPVMHVDEEGKLIVMEKVRGRRKSLDGLVKHMQETATNPEEQVVFISHGDCQKDAEYVANQVKEKLHVKDVLIHILDPVIGAHSGPGTVALFFIGTKR
ncbi:MAG: DegV family protein [bacterium]|nr:DegV family protein [bacterium]